MTTPSRKRLPLAWLLATLVSVPAAHAGLFDDDEARRAILDIRQKQEQSDARAKAQADANARLTEQIEQLRRSLLDLNGQLESLRGDLAKLRGQDEQLTRDVAELQRAQKDLQQGVDDRVRRL